MIDVILDAILDSLKAFVVLFVVYILLSFFEMKIANKLSKNHKSSPLFGSLFGLIPQCGISVVASDLYIKKHITIGTLIAVFISCSDEALPIILSGWNKNSLMIIPLILIKIIVGFIFGFFIDLLVNKKEVKEHLDNCNDHDIEIHKGCCNHHIDDEKEDKFDKHLWHPFIHSIKLFSYIMVINLIFGIFVHLIGEDNLALFLDNNKYLAPLYAVIIGIIPNCASSVIIAELFLGGVISFGATLAGLCVNAGLGMIFIFKSKDRIKENLIILFSIITISLFAGYLTCFTLGFAPV